MPLSRPSICLACLIFNLYPRNSRWGKVHTQNTYKKLTRKPLIIPEFTHLLQCKSELRGASRCHQKCAIWCWNGEGVGLGYLGVNHTYQHLVSTNEYHCHRFSINPYKSEGQHNLRRPRGDLNAVFCWIAVIRSDCTRLGTEWSRCALILNGVALFKCLSARFQRSSQIIVGGIINHMHPALSTLIFGFS